MAGPREFFAAIPARAFGDDRLKGHHLRVLGAVAMHDRFSRNGRGCVASYDRLAAIAGTNYSRLSSAVGDLVKWGYVAKERLADRRRAALRVIYTDQDRAFFESGHWQETAPDSLPTGNVNGLPTGKEHGGEIVCQTEKVVCLPNPERQQNQYDGSHKRLGETYRKDSAEAASLCDASDFKRFSRGHSSWTDLLEKAVASPGYWLRLLDDFLKQGALDRSRDARAARAGWYEIAVAIEGAYPDHDDPVRQWANRLAGEIECLIDGGSA
ncbi:MarR family transcriptional regulator [Oceanibaculum sp.]|uniref:MarR family transcriptional regulator n=1 Tax=Oceanibaculum sp. TaxID=1903597 RepID=UPI00258715A6|nr:helix-turn-helix domain-containing protein [Oceanibaculum sp.]MCH2393223.1 MarR family transcriptional regulator [Oceanibaculum sp.]